MTLLIDSYLTPLLGNLCTFPGPLTQGGCVMYKEVPKNMGDGDLTDFYIATHKHCSVKKGDELDSGKRECLGERECRG